MDFKKRLIEELNLSPMAANTMDDEYITVCEKLAREYHEEQVKNCSAKSKSSSEMKEQRLEILQKVANKELTPEQADAQLLGLSDVVESYCNNCGCFSESDICDDCDSLFDYENDEPDYSDFDCTCGAWKWSEKKAKPIHVADCICGSSEPW